MEPITKPIDHSLTCHTAEEATAGIKERQNILENLRNLTVLAYTQPVDVDCIADDLDRLFSDYATDVVHLLGNATAHAPVTPMLTDLLVRALEESEEVLWRALWALGNLALHSADCMTKFVKQHFVQLLWGSLADEGLMVYLLRLIRLLLPLANLGVFQIYDQTVSALIWRLDSSAEVQALAMQSLAYVAEHSTCFGINPVRLVTETLRDKLGEGVLVPYIDMVAAVLSSFNPELDEWLKQEGIYVKVPEWLNSHSDEVLLSTLKLITAAGMYPGFGDLMNQLGCLQQLIHLAQQRDEHVFLSIVDALGSVCLGEDAGVAALAQCGGTAIFVKGLNKPESALKALLGLSSMLKYSREPEDLLQAALVQIRELAESEDEEIKSIATEVYEILR